MAARPVAVGAARLGAGPLGLVAGPCVIESEELALRVAAALSELCAARGVPYIFKSSYQKANRSSLSSYAGPGLAQGLAALARVRRELGVPVLTDVHAVDEVAAAAEVADCLQVPAFLSRQTELILACARSGRVVNVKKGQFLAPDDMRQVAEKLAAGGARGVLLTERGASFGYHDLVVDFRSFVQLREIGWPVVFDVTHSLQRPGGAVTGGDRRFALPLARAAVACGVDALFVETHPRPERALSDAATQLPLEWMPELLDQCLRVRAAVGDAPDAGKDAP